MKLSLVIPRMASHRLAALRKHWVILGIAYCRFKGSDIVRIEDDYKRAPDIKAKAPVAG
ncbi:MAG: hypothetical protein MN733_32690 [Nitrososphaera sp.]|nr:hypothetical protein [Nitrososphaera sp.]